jgi:tRNA G18 (ribose-2'-O)-methylase SpoU
VPAFLGNAAILEGITGFHLHRGVLAAMNRPAPARLETVLSNAKRVAVLEDIGDHTNLGAVFRSAAALNIHAVLLSPSCADPLYRRAIRVSMGGVFQVPWARLPDGPLDLGALRSSGFVIGALALTPDAVGIEEFAAERHPRLALLLGTEGSGLSDVALTAADTAVRIPMHGDVDSLNVAAAAAVAFWECRERPGE